MHTIELTDEELRLLQNALHAYLDDFGHEEADVLREVKALIAKLSRSGDERGSRTSSATGTSSASRSRAPSAGTPSTPI